MLSAIDTPSALIVGAGVFGASVAEALSARGCQLLPRWAPVTATRRHVFYRDAPPAWRTSTAWASRPPRWPRGRTFLVGALPGRYVADVLEGRRTLEERFAPRISHALREAS